MRYAIVEQGVVTNLVELDADHLCPLQAGHDPACRLWHPPAGAVVVPAGEGARTVDASGKASCAAIGDRYDGASFVDPAVAPS